MLIKFLRYKKEEKNDLHMAAPKTQTSGFECSSMRTGGMQTSRMRRSAKLRLIRKILVELRRSLFLQTTTGTRMLPIIPMRRMNPQSSVEVTLIK